MEKIFEAFDLMDQGDYEGASLLLDQIGQQISPDSDDYYSYLSTLAYVKLGQGNIETARALYQTYLDKAQADHDWEQTHIGYHQQAMVERYAGHYQLALDLIGKEKSLIDHHFPKDQQKIAINRYEEAYLYHLLGLREMAEQTMQLSLAASLETDDLIAPACAYRGLGEICQDRTAFQRAADLFAQADDQQGLAEVLELMKQLG